MPTLEAYAGATGARSLRHEGSRWVSHDPDDRLGDDSVVRERDQAVARTVSWQCCSRPGRRVELVAWRLQWAVAGNAPATLRTR
jgi:hypothetical protein